MCAGVYHVGDVCVYQVLAEDLAAYIGFAAENTIDPAKLSIAHCIDSDCQEYAHQRPRVPVRGPASHSYGASSIATGVELAKDESAVTGVLLPKSAKLTCPSKGEQHSTAAPRPG
jgi:hypothetical protein